MRITEIRLRSAPRIPLQVNGSGSDTVKLVCELILARVLSEAIVNQIGIVICRGAPLARDTVPAFPDIAADLIVGTGLSGIGAPHYPQRHCQAKRNATLEARDSIGGTFQL